MSARQQVPALLYVAATCLAALAVVGWNTGFFPAGELPIGEPGFWVFAALVFAGELWPIKARRRNDDDVEVPLSTTFAFALLLAFGLLPAIVVLATAAVVADLLARRPLWKAGFNAAQYTLALAAAAGLLALVDPPPLAGTSDLTVLDLPVLGLSAAAMLLSSYVIVSIGVALSLRVPVWPAVRSDFAFHTGTSGALLSLAPVFVVVAQHSLPLIPVLLAMAAAFYRTVRVSQEHEQEALHDALTGLPNRRFFAEQATNVLRGALEGRLAPGVLLFDVDKFKQINDTLGHHAGDHVLREIARRVRRALPAHHVFARLGGDEFAVLVPAVRDPREPEIAARTVLRNLEEPLAVEGCPLRVEVSIGIAVAPDHGHDVDTLLRCADVAMFSAKRARTGFERYREDEPQTSRPGRLELVGELRRAIQQDELDLHFQPLATMHDRRVVGAEALVRWRHPRHGLIPPAEFIPLAENSELIGPLSRYVLKTAIAQCAAWHRQGLALAVSVNLSARDLYDVELPAVIHRLLRTHALDANWLKLEVTENTVRADPERATAVLGELDAMGARLAIDDFGTGYSSLSHLKQLPVSEIKIDRSFVSGLSTDIQDAVIVPAVVELGRNLGLHVVAEGVEDRHVWRRLAGIGCDLAQGYHLSRPVPHQQLTEWLRGHNATNPAQHLLRPPLFVVQDPALAALREA